MTDASKPIDLCIVGAGAAGLAAAIFAAEEGAALEPLAYVLKRKLRPRPAHVSRACTDLPLVIPRSVHLLDGAQRIGAKILISGGGRCNVTHHIVTESDFAGTSHVVRHILAAFDAEAAVQWFAAMGVALKREETGKLFPVTDKARTVLQALLDRCRQLGITVQTGHRVSAITNLADASDGARFSVRHDEGELRARRVILATGGRSLPKTGSDGFGWELVRRLGHSVTDTVPALVPLLLSETFFHASLSGLSQPVELTTLVEGKSVDRRAGSLLWTHFGVSGPVVMDASRFWTGAKDAGQTAMLHCNFFPGKTQEDTRQWLRDEAAKTPRRQLLNTLTPHLPERMAAALCRFASCDPAIPLGQLPKEQRERVIGALTRLVLPVQKDRGWNYAEVTAGGVPLDEINFRTMESKKVPGLYLIGEMLDCDGRIGGFNFQWAWATGYLAGRAASVSL